VLPVDDAVHAALDDIEGGGRNAVDRLQRGGVAVEVGGYEEAAVAESGHIPGQLQGRGQHVALADDEVHQVAGHPAAPVGVVLPGGQQTRLLHREEPNTRDLSEAELLCAFPPGLHTQ